MATDLSLQRVQDSWLRWAVNSYIDKQEDYEKYEDYYEGEHELEFATEAWENVFGSTFKQFADNWCQVVVDTTAQRLQISGWSSETNEEDAGIAEEIWDDSMVEREARDLHTHSLVKGDGYLMVWPNAEDGDKIDIFYNDALDINVFYDPANKRRITRGSKRWMDELAQIHLRLYFPDRTEGFVIPRQENRVYEIESGLQTLEPEDREILPEGWEREGAAVRNPYGIVPIFHFKNKASGSTHGISEVKVVIPIQNAVNKILMDMMIGSEFGAFRQKWMAGGGHPKEGWKSGPTRIWATTDPNAKFGAFPETDLEPYTRVVETLVGHIAKTTQTPMHYLRASGDMPSGDAMKFAESTLVFKARDRQKAWGETWSRAMSFAVALKKGAKDSNAVQEQLRNPVRPLWVDPELRHDLEQAQTAQLKSVLGVPLEKLWSEHFDYSEDEIAKFKEMNKAVAASMLAQMIAQVGQLPPGLSEQAGVADVPKIRELLAAAQKGDVTAIVQAVAGLDPSQILALLPKSITAETTSGEATAKPQPNTAPPASPTRRSRGFKD